MKIILNYMAPAPKTELNEQQEREKLEVFLFKYISSKRIITTDYFRKNFGHRLKGIRFPEEFQCKIKKCYIDCLHLYLTEQKDISFLCSLAQEHPEYYEKAEKYLKQFFHSLLYKTAQTKDNCKDMLIPGYSWSEDLDKTGFMFAPAQNPKQ